MDYRPYILAGMLLLVLVAFVTFIVVLIRSRRAPVSHVSYEHHDASIQPTRPLDTSLEGLEVVIDEDAPSASLLTPLRTGEWMPPDRPAPVESLPSVSLTERVAEYRPAPDIREPAFAVESPPAWLTPAHELPINPPSDFAAPISPTTQRMPEAPTPDIGPTGPADDDLTEQIAALLPTDEPSGEAGAEPEFDLDTLVRSLSDEGTNVQVEASTDAAAPEVTTAPSMFPSGAVGQAEPYAEMPPTPEWTPPVPQPAPEERHEPEIFIAETLIEEPEVEPLLAEPPPQSESHPAEEGLPGGFGPETVPQAPAPPSEELEPIAAPGDAVALTQEEPQTEMALLGPAPEAPVPAEVPAIPTAPAETRQAEPEVAEPEPEWIDMMREQQGTAVRSVPKPAAPASAPRPAATVNPAPMTPPKPAVQAPAEQRRVRPQVKVHRAEEAEAAAGAGSRRIAPLRASGSTRASDRRSGPIPDIVMEAPVEMWFGDSRVGVKAGTATYERFRKYADVLFADLKASERQSR